jgi:N-acyl-D-aspartate/D-glutamate deacylase
MRNEADGLFEALDEAIGAARAAGEGARLQVSHLKAASRPVHGRGAEAVAVIERARAEGLDAAADQYPYVAAATTLATILPPSVLALDPPEAAALLRTPSARHDVRVAIERGISGWENVGADPGWDGIAIAWSPSRPEWAGRTLAGIGRDLGVDPLDLALDVLAADDLAVDCVIACMTEADVEAIMAMPWIAICTDAEGRRPDHPVLGHGVPHPRTYGSAPRVLGRYVRERGVLPLETAIAKLTSVPAERLGLRDRGVVREGAAADLVVLDPTSVLDRATFEAPARYPTGIAHVIVNGVAAVLDGAETGARPGRLLRRT